MHIYRHQRCQYKYKSNGSGIKRKQISASAEFQQQFTFFLPPQPFPDGNGTIYIISPILLTVWFYLRQKHFIFLFCKTASHWNKHTHTKTGFYLHWSNGCRHTVQPNSVRLVCILFLACVFSIGGNFFGLYSVIFAVVCNLFHNCSSANGQSIIFDLQPKIGISF